MSNEMETRTVNSPRTGTKVSLMIAAAALAVAVYYYTTDTHFTGNNGGIFGCGSPMHPNNNSLGKSQCQILESGGMHKALLFLALALISAVLGALLFGVEKSTQHRGVRSRLDDEQDDDDLDESDEDRESRSGLLSGRRERQFGHSKREERSSKRLRPRLGDEDLDEDEFEDDEPRRGRTVRVKGDGRSRKPRFDDDLDDEDARVERKQDRRRNRYDEGRDLDDEGRD